MASESQVTLKILHLVKTSFGGEWAFRQMRELRQLGVEVHVALPPGGPLVPEYEAAGIEVHPWQFNLPLGNPWLFPQISRDLKHLVETINPDIIHSHFVGTTLTMRLALGRSHPVPRVFQVPGPLHLEYALLSWGEIMSAGPADYWIGSCKWTCRQYLKDGVPKDRVFLSYYATDLDKFASCQNGKLRRELGVGKNVPLVGMVAYMYAPKRFLGQSRGLKGHEDLIDAIALAAGKNPNILGVFIGGAWDKAEAYEKRVRAYARERCGDRAVFLGTRSDVIELYPDLDVAVHPSYSENVGGAVESFLCGIPTIATNVGGLPDLVIPNETGWLVPPRSPAHLAAAILEALENPERARTMALKGQQLTRQLFDIKQTAKQILAIYRQIISTHGL